MATTTVAGAYEGRLIRRTDPHHRSLGRFFQEEVAVAGPYVYYIGLPPSVPDSKVATIEGCCAPDALAQEHHAGGDGAWLHESQVAHQKDFRQPQAPLPWDFNRPEYRRVELPAGNGIGYVRSMAKAYGVFAAGGREARYRRRDARGAGSAPTTSFLGSHDEVLKAEMSYFWASTDLPGLSDLAAERSPLAR